jgi:hypothetical protein
MTYTENVWIMAQAIILVLWNSSSCRLHYGIHRFGHDNTIWKYLLIQLLNSYALLMCYVWRFHLNMRVLSRNIMICYITSTTQTKKLMAFSPQANYTDWSTATGQRTLVPTFVDRGVLRGQCSRTPTTVNISLLDQSCYFFFQVAPHLSSRGWVDPVPDPLLLRS